MRWTSVFSPGDEVGDGFFDWLVPWMRSRRWQGREGAEALMKDIFRFHFQDGRALVLHYGTRFISLESLPEGEVGCRIEVDLVVVHGRLQDTVETRFYVVRETLQEVLTVIELRAERFREMRQKRMEDALRRRKASSIPLEPDFGYQEALPGSPGFEAVDEMTLLPGGFGYLG